MITPGRISMTILVFLLLIGALAAAQIWQTRAAEKNAPPRGRFVEVDGQRIHLVDLPPQNGAGGPPLVLIHGASVNLRDMEIALGPELSKTNRVIIVDRPGRGYSTRPEDGWRLDVQAKLIHDAVAALGAENPVIVGQSLGGAVALSYALHYQNGMSGLVLLAPVSHEWPGGVAWYNNVSSWPVAGFLLRRLVIPIYGPLAARSGIKESFAPNEPPDDYYEKSGLGLLFRPADFKANAADLAHLKPQIIAMSRHYSEIRVPTAILAGASDTTVSPKIHAAHLAQDIKGARFELLPNTGHALHHAETAKVVAAIRRIAKEAGDAPDSENADPVSTALQH